MKIAYNPKDAVVVTATTAANNDILFDLNARKVWAKGLRMGADWEDISNKPSSLKNPYALTISLNGTSQDPYDGSAAKNINITPSSIGAATSGHNHDGRYVYNYGSTKMDANSLNKNALGMSNNSGITGDWWCILQAAWNSEYRWNSQIAFPTQNRKGIYYRSGLQNNTAWGDWVKLLDTNNSYVAGGKGYINSTEITQVNNASKLQTARNLWGNSFDGTKDINGSIIFPAIGDTAISNKISWSGSSDGADIYYQTISKDQGNLVLNVKDDTNAYIQLALNGTFKSHFDVANSYWTGRSAQADKWTTAHTFTIGNTAKNVDGSGNVSWSLAEIGAAPNEHTHAWDSLTHSSTTKNQAILTNGENKWKLQELNIDSWNNASAFVSTITDKDTDDIINKWNEIVNFLADIKDDNTLNTLLNSKLSVYKLANNTDVSTLINNGIYYRTTSTSLTNSPFNNEFTLLNITNYQGNNNLIRSRLAFNSQGELKIFDERQGGTWNEVVTTNTGLLKYSRNNVNISSSNCSPIPPSLLEWTIGYPRLYDPEFNEGYNNVQVYNNANNGVVTVTRVSDTNVGNSSNYILKVVSAVGAVPYCGGWHVATQTELGKVYTCLFRANVPSGVEITFNTNSIGTGGQWSWLTSYIGTGKWTWYAAQVYCGSGGSTTFHFAAMSPCTWYLSYVNVIENNRASYAGLRSVYSDYLKANTSIVFERNELQYFNQYTSTTSGATNNANPTTDWYHILRMNHANGSGFFVDLAIPFNDNRIQFRRIVAGADAGWHRIITEEPNNHNVLLCDSNARGNVGIGTSNPTQKLDVLGNIRASGQIVREASSVYWYGGREGALLRETSAGGYHTLWSLKTTDGSWDFGEYTESGQNNVPLLSYVTDSNYNSGNNTTTYQIKFPLASGIVALTHQIPTSLPANGGNADMVDGYHADKYLMVPTTIDASALDVNTYYPVTIYLPAKNTRIEVEVSLDSGTKPSWSTHNAGFTSRKIWESNGSGWGTTSVERNIFVSTYSYASEDPIRGIGQLTNSSIEFVYVRGGGKYFFKVSVGGGTPTLQKATYTVNNETVAPTKTAPASIIPSIIDKYYWANIKISDSPSINTSPTVNTLTATRVCAGHDPGIDNSISCSGWFRSSGDTGWYNTTYRGGWYMSDTDWIRAHNNVGIYTGGQIYSSNSIRMGDIYLQNGNEINNNSGTLYLNYSASTNINMCHGGGAVIIGPIIDAGNNKLYVNGAATIAGSTTLNSTATFNGLVYNNGGILPATCDFNNTGAAYSVWGDAMSTGVTAITDALDPTYVDVQYSQDSGTTWIDYALSDQDKFNLYANNGSPISIFLGNNGTSSLAQVQKNQLMVTFEIPNSLYSALCWASVDIGHGIETVCTVEIISKNGTIIRTFTKTMIGWNKFNYINFWGIDNSITDIGNDQARFVRFKFKHDTGNTNIRNAQIRKIRLFSFTKFYLDPSDFRSVMGNTGHLYKYDKNLNVTFPNIINCKTLDITNSIRVGNNLSIYSESGTKKLAQLDQSDILSIYTNIYLSKGLCVGLQGPALAGSATTDDASAFIGTAVSGSFIFTFKPALNGQLLFLKLLKSSATTKFMCATENCRVIRSSDFSVSINTNRAAEVFGDGRSRIFIYQSTYSSWFEFYCG